MDSFSIIEASDIFENAFPSLFPRFVSLQVDQFLLDYTVKRFDARVSSPEELHPQALSEPDLNLSAHPAPIIQPNLNSSSPTGRRVMVLALQFD
jgi:hypothetical protein